jgi:hypothetical protein
MRICEWRQSELRSPGVSSGVKPRGFADREIGGLPLATGGLATAWCPPLMSQTDSGPAHVRPAPTPGLDGRLRCHFVPPGVYAVNCVVNTSSEGQTARLPRGVRWAPRPWHMDARTTVAERDRLPPGRGNADFRRNVRPVNLFTAWFPPE